MPVVSRQILLLPENRSAIEALRKAAERASSANRKPKLIYLYGASGSGKSLLISKLLRDSLRAFPKLKHETVTASAFAAELADASESNTIDRFQAKYRNLDLLVCEDLQSLRKRKESQIQLLHCIDHVLERGGVVVFTATSLPGHWANFDARLQDRCHGGLTVGIDLPSPAGRVKLVRHFVQQEHVPFPKAAIESIAKAIEGSPRDLEGFVTRVIEAARRTGAAITPEFVNQQLAEEVTVPDVSLKVIIRKVASYFDLKVKDLKSNSRRADVVRARQFAMFLARKLTKLTQQEIAKTLGMADHTSVIRAEKKIAELLENDSSARLQLSELRDLFVE